MGMIDDLKKFKLDTVTPCYDPVPNTTGSIGHGEAAHYNGKTYFYNVNKRFPKDKVFSVKWEGFHCGRVHGEVEHIILAFNGESFTVLERSFKGNLKRDMAKYKGMSPDEAIAFVMAKHNEVIAHYEASVKCKECGEPATGFADGQAEDQCFDCYLRQKKDLAKSQP